MFLELWNSSENSILIDTVIELEKERIEKEANNTSLMIWIAQSIGFFHACFHNSGMAGYTEKITKNPVFENAPPKIKEMLGLNKKETPYTEEDMKNLFFPHT